MNQILSFIIFSFFLGFALADFDWSICDYGRNSSLSSVLYSDEEIKFRCGLHYREAEHRNLRPSQYELNPYNLPRNTFAGIRSTRFKRSSVAPLEDIKQFIYDCEGVGYRSIECQFEGRERIYKMIKERTFNLKEKADLILLTNLLDGLDFSLYHNKMEEEEISFLLEVFDHINWNSEISETFIFPHLIKRSCLLFARMIQAEPTTENGLKVLVAHEKIFSNFLQWKLLNPTELFRDFFLTLEMIYVSSNPSPSVVDRMNNYIYEMSNIVANNWYWINEYKDFKYYTYSFYYRRLSYLDRKKFRAPYTYKSIDDVLPIKFHFTLGQHDVYVHLQEDSDLNEIKKIYQETYDRFISVMNSTGLLPLNKTKITLRVFKNKKEYELNGAMFDFGTRNTGITYALSNEAWVYCYQRGKEILNLGHELIHAFVPVYFSQKKPFPIFIHEGLAEALGEDESFISSRFVTSLFDDHDDLTFNKMKKFYYDGSISVYKIGFTIIRTLIKTNLTSDLINGLRNYETSNELESLINQNINQFKTFAFNYSILYDEAVKEDQEEKSRLLKRPEEIKRVYLNHYPGDKLLIVIDNTYFNLSRDSICLYFKTSVSPYCDREILNSHTLRTMNDFEYLISYMIYTSVKQIPNYELVFPELLNLKQENKLFYSNREITNSVIKRNVFNRFFAMANDLGLNRLSIPLNSFTDVEGFISTKNRIQNTLYYTLSIPAWNVTNQIQKAIYTINSETNLDLDLIRSIDPEEKIDVENRDVVQIFSDFFPLTYLTDKRVTRIKRSTGWNYLQKNLPIEKQFTAYFNSSIASTTLKPKTILFRPSIKSNSSLELKPLSSILKVKPISPFEVNQTISISNEVKPIESNEVKPIHSNEVKPISISNEVKPISISNEVKPIHSNEVKPISISNEVKPISISNEVKPISISNEVKPISISNEVKPISNEVNQTKEVKPIHSNEVNQSISNERSEVNQTIHSNEVKPISISNEVNQSISISNERSEVNQTNEMNQSISISNERSEVNQTNEVKPIHSNEVNQSNEVKPISISNERSEVNQTIHSNEVNQTISISNEVNQSNEVKPISISNEVNQTINSDERSENKIKSSSDEIKEIVIETQKEVKQITDVLHRIIGGQRMEQSYLSQISDLSSKILSYVSNTSDYEYDESV